MNLQGFSYISSNQSHASKSSVMELKTRNIPISQLNASSGDNNPIQKLDPCYNSATMANKAKIAALKSRNQNSLEIKTNQKPHIKHIFPDKSEKIECENRNDSFGRKYTFNSNIPENCKINHSTCFKSNITEKNTRVLNIDIKADKGNVISNTEHSISFKNKLCLKNDVSEIYRPKEEIFLNMCLDPQEEIKIVSGKSLEERESKYCLNENINNKDISNVFHQQIKPQIPQPAPRKFNNSNLGVISPLIKPRTKPILNQSNSKESDCLTEKMFPQPAKRTFVNLNKQLLSNKPNLSENINKNSLERQEMSNQRLIPPTPVPRQRHLNNQESKSTCNQVESSKDNHPLLKLFDRSICITESEILSIINF